MENELLQFEVNFLKGRVAEGKRTECSLKKTINKLKFSKEVKAKAGESVISNEERAQLQRSHEDLVLLLRRLRKSPLWPLLRLRPAFRELEKRYLD